MSVSTNSDDDSGGLALVATARSGAWEISVSEAISGPDRWVAEIESDATYVTFELSSPQVILDLARFLRPPVPAAAARLPGQLPLGTFNGLSVAILRDDEFADRHFIRIGEATGYVVRMTVAGEGVRALEQAASEIARELGALRP